MQAFFPAILSKDEEVGGYVVEVVGAGVNGEGESDVSALRNAAEILQEVIWNDVAAGREFPRPTTPTEEDRARGVVTLIQATVPAAAVQQETT